LRGVSPLLSAQLSFCGGKAVNNIYLTDAMKEAIGTALETRHATDAARRLLAALDLGKVEIPWAVCHAPPVENGEVTVSLTFRVRAKLTEAVEGVVS
jgi:expansin (peptidoglycan-binding protein)